jgi:murein DD-endopeptidase MepM/ murein hydrolase activator NlpD
MDRRVLPFMDRRQSHETVYIFRMRRSWRPLLALFCLVAGMSAGVHSQLAIQSSAAVAGLDKPAVSPELPAAEVMFLLPDPGQDLSENIAVNEAKEYDDLLGLLRASRTRADDSESRALSFIWPVEGKVTDAFGWRTHPITGKRQFHNGIDIAARSGTPVRSVAAGTVEFTGWSEGYGRIIIISHGEGYRSKYGHLSRYVVSSGQKVTRGEIIGYVGESGNATGPHCHFEVEIGGRAVDPNYYLP